MLTKLQLVVLGIVVVHGASFNAMDKELKSLRSSEGKQLVAEVVCILNGPAEIKKSSNQTTQALETQKTAPIQIQSSNNQVPFSYYHNYPGNSPKEYWIPIVYGLEHGCVSDCP